MPVIPIQRLILSIGLVLLFLRSLTAEEAVYRSSLESPHFEVVGRELRSVSFVAELASYLVEANSSILSDVPPSFHQRILIVLREQDDRDFSGDYRISRSPGGFVRLDITWHEGLSLERCLQAVNESFVFRYVIYNYGSEAPEKMKAWAVAALAAEAYIGLRPTMVEVYKNTVGALPVSDLSEMLAEPYAPDLTTVELRAIYPMLSGLRDDALPLSEYSKLVAAGLRGAEVALELEALIADQGLKEEPITLEEWWMRACVNFINTDTNLYETMAVSQSWIREMADFSVLEALQIPNLRALWNLRYNPEVRDILAARLELIRLRLDSVNPAYFNAARALGALYETLLNGGRKHEFIFALSVYLSDYDDTASLELKVAQTLAGR
ncbi:MAG: hypothetical protein AAGC73_10840 [Verrucomicrobiota bacterium]